MEAIEYSVPWTAAARRLPSREIGSMEPLELAKALFHMEGPFSDWDSQPPTKQDLFLRRAETVKRQNTEAQERSAQRRTHDAHTERNNPMATAPATLTNIRIIEDAEGIVVVTCGDCAHIYANQDGLTIRALTTQDDRTRRNPATCQECQTALDWTVPRGMELPPRGLGEAGSASRAYTRGLGEAGTATGRAY